MKKTFMIAAAVMVLMAGVFWFSQASTGTPKDLALAKETEHALFYLHKTEQDTTDMLDIVSDEFEKQYDRLTEWFQFSPSQKTVIYIYTDKEKFRQYIGRDTEGTYDQKDNIIKVYTPDRLDRNDLRTEYTDQLVHEFVHSLILQINPSLGKTKWLDEGAAFYAAKQLEATIDSWKYIGLDPPDLDELLNPEYFEKDGGRAYYFSGLLVQFIAETYGKETLNQVIRDPKDIERLLGAALADVYTEWTAYVDALYE